MRRPRFYAFARTSHRHCASDSVDDDMVRHFYLQDSALCDHGVADFVWRKDGSMAIHLLHCRNDMKVFVLLHAAQIKPAR